MAPSKAFARLLYLFKSFTHDNFIFLNEFGAIIGLRRSYPTNTCHILISKHKVYARIAKYAISSFLYYNKSYGIVLHCDGITLNECRKLSIMFGRRRISVILDQPKDSDPYFEQVILFYKLNKTKDMLMDADLRWRGALPEIESAFLYNSEFDMSATFPWNRLIESFPWSHISPLFMLTGSVSGWQGFSPPYSEDDVRGFLRDLNSFDWTLLEMPLPVSFYQRLTGQVVMSFLAQSSQWTTITGAENLSGKIIVESTYFGNSGLRYGR